MKPEQDFKTWVLGIVAALIVAATGGGIAWAQSIHGQVERLEERTESLDQIQHDLAVVRENVARICERLDVVHREE